MEEHFHEHTHASGVTHSHETPHEHGREAGSGGDAMAQTLALMEYMHRHNAAHTRELAQLAQSLNELGKAAAAERALAAVAAFETGNERLSQALAALK